MSHGLALLLLLACAPAVYAEALTSVERATLPALPVADVQADLQTLDDQLIAFSPDQAWRLSADARQWQPLAWQGAAPRLLSLGGNGKRLFALAEDGNGRHLEELVISGNQIQRKPLAAWPSALTWASFAVMDDRLYVAGSASDGDKPVIRQWNLATPGTWADGPAWPSQATRGELIAQTRALYVVEDGPAPQALWRHDSEAGWQSKPPVPGERVPGSLRMLGQAHLLMLVRGNAGADAASPADAPARLMSYHTITSAWAQLPDAGAGAVVASGAYKNGLVWYERGADGVVHGQSAQLTAGKYLLKWMDWLVIVVYLASMIGIGMYFYIKEKRNSTSDFFVGGRSIPFWAAGVSLYATNTSSISFIAIPAKAFETNWQYMTNNLIAVLGLMFVAVWIVPLLRRLDLMSVFSYLETRFHPAIRMIASALCIAMQVGARMSVILFLPALAIATITGISVVWSVILMGVFTIIYTAMGGMKAVIWTDFVQVFVKMGGAMFAIGFIIWHLKGGVPEFFATAMAEQKMHTLDFSFDLTKATVWGFIFLVIFDVVLTFPKDQVLMQRTLSTKSDKEAGRSIWAFAAIMIPGGFIFYGIGTALFVHYKNNPERLNPLLPIDATFPLFIAAELPPGVTGLIIAGIFAAAMATLSSIMNSVATLISVDFYEKLAKNPNQKKSVLFAEVTTVMVGLVAIGLALLLSRYDIHSLFDISIELAGLLGGGFAGAYTLGMFTRRANSAGVAIGIGCSIVLTFIAWSFNLVHPYFYLAISILLCIVIGYLASLLFPAPTRSLKGLTIYRDVE
ncbi:sodium:solute symporter [Pseudoxanthomonas indica]|uniref:sodium:solute symporter n=1 Tax=Pseudoxanthomonas indica TaxID=428993 RepID=UPI001E2F5637|nr:sodium:solute symporter [Pseudoxanthomonas indica]